MKRFYKEVTAEPVETGWQVKLDGRGIRTAGKCRQHVPSRALAEEMAAEWACQGEEIDASRFVLRDMADYAIDVIAPAREAAIRELLPYGETDTLCYRAEESDALLRRQIEVWEPLLRAAEARWDVHFERASGIIHRPQPEATLARLQTVLDAENAFTLAALKSLASLAASLVVALTAIAPEADAEVLWNAANLEEDWQAELWGKDAEAEALRARRFRDFSAAMRFAELVRV